jgi:hypothetical protein
VVGAPT